jgi:hypothetical protein
MTETTTRLFFTSPACGGGRCAERVGREHFIFAVPTPAPSPTLPRKRGREKRGHA